MKNQITNRILVLLFLLVIACLFLVGTARAQALEPTELQPTYIFMVDDLEYGYVYQLDYGWVIMRGTTVVPFCGCGVEDCTMPYIPVTESTDVPPKPTVVPTEPPVEPCRPGWGYGDDNHCHSGPPGQDK